jgi:CDGSH-type Zn-finger protein
MTDGEPIGKSWLAMPEPNMADKKPAVVDLQPGEYWWCACGKSSSQPFCDGSHKGTEFRPVRFEVAEARKAALCNCKHAAAPIFCDGTHKTL